MIINGIYIALGAFFGAISRYQLSKWINTNYNSKFPYGTLTVNLLGSLLLGFVIGRQFDETIVLIFGTGFLGAFTTFSTFKVESLNLIKNKKVKTMLIYILLTYILGILLAFIGYLIGFKIR